MRWSYYTFLWPTVFLAALASSLKLGPASLPGQARAAFPSCEAAAKSCVTHFTDHTSYPNIAAGRSVVYYYHKFKNNSYNVLQASEGSMSFLEE